MINNKKLIFAALTTLVLSACSSSNSPDFDRDGVVRGLDHCPGTQGGAWVDENGCALDNTVQLEPDNETVPTYDSPIVDHAHVKIEINKTPELLAEPIVETVVEIDPECVDYVETSDFKVNSFAPLHYATNAWQLTRENKVHLDCIAVATKASGFKLEVQGNTDDVGSADYNAVLSDKRANEAYEYLMSKGVETTLVSTVGLGYSQPVSGNDTAEGRGQNRRVDFLIEKAEE